MRGVFVFLAAAGAMAAVALPAATGAQTRPASALSAGEKAFQKCYSCHALDDGGSGAQGPSLKGIVGRPVAAAADYDYSAAMRGHAKRQPRWTRAALDAFIANPHKVVPDNEMGFFGIRDPAERKALVDYLAQAGAGAAR